MTWLTWPFRLIGLVLWFAKEVVAANWIVVKDNLTPGQGTTPGIVRFDTRCRTDAEITLLAAMITLTPGTLVIGTEGDASTPRRALFVHGMYAPDGAAMRTSLERMERTMLRAIRREGVA